MKASGAAVLSFAALVAAEPVFLNSDYTVVAGEPFTLTFDGCEGGCTITLETGPEDLLEPVQELTSKLIWDASMALPRDDYDAN
jgi:hypothetical protein